MAYPLLATSFGSAGGAVASQSRNWLTERLMDLPYIRLVLAGQRPHSAGSRKNSEDY
jgi:hypothetical protein